MGVNNEFRSERRDRETTYTFLIHSPQGMSFFTSYIEVHVSKVVNHTFSRF